MSKIGNRGLNAIWETMNLENQNFYFDEQENKAIYFRGTMKRVCSAKDSHFFGMNGHFLCFVWSLTPPLSAYDPAHQSAIDI